jgi:hypothetical protein
MGELVKDLPCAVLAALIDNDQLGIFYEREYMSLDVVYRWANQTLFVIGWDDDGEGRWPSTGPPPCSFLARDLDALRDGETGCYVLGDMGSAEHWCSELLSRSSFTNCHRATLFCRMD